MKEQMFYKVYKLKDLDSGQFLDRPLSFQNVIDQYQSRNQKRYSVERINPRMSILEQYQEMYRITPKQSKTRATSRIE